MSNAYTPGLTIAERALLRKIRRLPLPGEVLVEVGQPVEPDTIVARCELPGEVTLLRAADKLGVTGAELVGLLRHRVGDTVAAGELLAETPGLFGRFFKSQLHSPVAGTLETVTERTGNLTLRQAPRPVELPAYLAGRVVELLPGEGAVIEAVGALVQGIFGIGGERTGRLRAPGDHPAEAVGEILVWPGRVTAADYRAAAAAGAVGLVAGSITDGDLRAILGYDIGVAITGEEAVPTTLIVTEGFGQVPMAERTLALLTSLAGRRASLSGATQIRAGVVRPEILAPAATATPESAATGGPDAQILLVGSRIRLIREPFFGVLATVAELPAEPRTIATGAAVRVLRATLDDGRVVDVPRANVELVAG